MNDWEEEPTLGPEPRKYQPEWIDFLFSCPSTLPHHIISLSSRFHSARRVSSLHSNCFQVYDVNGSVEWRKERDTSGHRETTEAGREVKTRPRRAEWAKGGDRDERKEERSRPSLTPLAPSVRHSFGSVSSRSLTLLLPPGGAEWRGEPETRSTDEEGRSKVKWVSGERTGLRPERLLSSSSSPVSVPATGPKRRNGKWRDYIDNSHFSLLFS